LDRRGVVPAPPPHWFVRPPVGLFVKPARTPCASSRARRRMRVFPAGEPPLTYVRVGGWTGSSIQPRAGSPRPGFPTAGARLPTVRQTICSARLAAGGLTRCAMAGASLWPPASVTTPDLRAESRRERSRPGVWADVDGPDVHNQPAWHPHPRAYLPRSMNTLEDIVELPTPDDEGGGLAVTLADNVQSLVQPPNASSPRPRPRTHEVKPVLHDVTASQSDFKQASRMLLAQQKQHNDAFRQYNQNCGTIQDANERIQLVAESESNQARRAVRIMDEYSRASAPAPEWSVRSTR